MSAKFCFLAVLVGLLCSLAVAQEQTWIEVNGESFGARPDDRGPIGGGVGYADVMTQGDHIATNLDELIEALGKATAGQVVFIPGETEMDLTARIYIEGLVLEVPAGVTLAGNRGQDGSKGAILTSDSLKTPGMIRAAGPDVRITGLRLRGPNPKRYMDHHRRSFAEGRGHEYYYKLPTSNGIVSSHDRTRVDNCEISGFSHGGIYLSGGSGHRVHHCFIHHCQYQGLGYGVVINMAQVLIEYNLFDHNRHSIAGTGRSGEAYEARHNVELGVSLSHCFDMHGGRDRKDGTNIAGAKILIHHNTFRAPTTPVVIRGEPEEACEVFNNWFPRHANPQAAVKAEAGTRVYNNAHGAADVVTVIQ